MSRKQSRKSKTRPAKYIEPKPKYDYKSAKAQAEYLKSIDKYSAISLCMIVSDQESPADLKRCLRSVVEWVDQIVVILNYKQFKKNGKMIALLDTIVELDEIKEVETEILYEKWTDFADMRNKSFEKSTGDYNLYLDCDDVFIDPVKMREYTKDRPEAEVFRLRVMSDRDIGVPEILIQPRLLRNRPEYRFRNKCHEDISYSIAEAMGEDYTSVVTDMYVRHLGNISTDRVHEHNERNLKLLLEDYNAGKAHSLTYFHLANSYLLKIERVKNKKKQYALGEKIVALCDEALAKGDMFIKDDPIIPKFWNLRGSAILYCYRAKKEAGSWEAAMQSFTTGWKDYKSVEAAVNIGVSHVEREEFDKAIEVLEELKALVVKEDGIKITGIPVDTVSVERLMLKHLGDCYYRKIQEKKYKTVPNEGIGADDCIGETYQELKEQCMFTKEVIDKEATAKHKAEMLKQAEENYSFYMNIDPTNLEVIDRLADILRNTGRMNEAVQLTAMGVNTYPTYFNGWNNLALNEILHKRYATARCFLRECLRINPKLEQAVQNLKQVENALKAQGKV